MTERGEALAAQLSQMRTEARTLAQMCRIHHEEYMAEGFDRDEALELVAAFLGGLTSTVRVGRII